MDYLPLFADIKARPVLVVGAGDVATRKIELLQQAGAEVHLVAPALSPPLLQQCQQGRLNWLAPAFVESQLDAVFLVIAATDDHELNARIFTAATQRHRLVNVVDDRQHCSFIFPAIVDRSPVIVALSSGGAAPVLVRLLREKLEALLPHRLGNVAALAGKWREKVKQRFASVAERRRFWEHLFNSRFVSLVTKGDIPAAEAHLHQSLSPTDTIFPTGEVALVGAGPGDPGLLTLRALQVMQQADVVLYDHLVSHDILDLVRRDAKRICVGKRAGAHSVPQEETNTLLIEWARQGKKVVRLKGGDPFIFGRGGEELQAAAAAGIPFQVVPGITAAAGVSAYAGIPLTHRDYAQSVTLITGHCRPKVDELDWPSLARGRQTLAIYMGTINAAEISHKLITYGRAATTPVAAIGCGTRDEQQVVTGTLQQLEQLAQQVSAPTLLIIGEVVALHHQLAWFRQTLSTERESIVNLS